MKKLFLILLLCLSAIPAPAWGKVKVVTTLPIFAALANAVGGERVTIKSLAKPKEDPHFLVAKPIYVVDLNRADLLIHAGLELEIGWLPVLLTQARNPKIQPGSSGNMDASEGVRALEVPTGQVDRSQGDIHPLGNPHYWLDPRNAVIISQNLFSRLVDADPEGEAYYQKRMQAFLAKLQEKMETWRQKAAPLRGKQVVAFHKTWTYFADWTGLQVIANVEPLPGIPPSAQHTDWLLQIIPQNQVKAILMAPFYPRKVPDYLSQKTSVPVLDLPVQPSSPEESSFFEFFEQLIASLNRVNK